ncbi:Sugar transferase involved in LPS biosynthesis (colanic, teichoic acid) [Paenibacillus uliginis N3/975]|uniref:Sugar transferase involved in LPS biosynthesis (Colanic, teichoic acid) n=1 Tax=Paenibacillus uliginis N3/975 TaxID=1313296 RepID=A0A1X7HUJ4_9BACL|nr:sugar transferase [Paenibacillus uliginis]SMF92169.1 Sugar transferase involved in LPS biosynthesis (colanic, teichoic acid) [Paenibacillus uliginis N3/975]
MYPTPQRNEAEVVFEGTSKYTNYALEELKPKVLYLMVKRVMDFIFALIGLVLLLPLFLIVSILIKLEDPQGSIFFYQTRIGKNEKPFRMYKFRSMVSNAEELLEKLLDQNEISGAMFKIKEDPRITSIGKFIRKTSIDELPQLWNVIRGEMSLVGPRPALPREVNQYSKYDKLRLKVTPGCTGLWQVSGRNELSFNEMVELDLRYIEQRGIITDLKIILHTVKVMFGSKDAF